MEGPSRGIPSIPSSKGVIRDLWALSLFHTARWPEVCPLHLPVFLTGGKDGFAPRRTFLEPTGGAGGCWRPERGAGLVVPCGTCVLGSIRCLQAATSWSQTAPNLCGTPSVNRSRLADSWCPSETHFSWLADLCSQQHNLAREER